MSNSRYLANPVNFPAKTSRKPMRPRLEIRDEIRIVRDR